MDKTYRLSKKWKGVFIALGVISCLLIVLAPLGILMFVMAARARIAVGEQAITVWWMGKRTMAWNEFAELHQGSFSVHGLGVVGAVAGAALVKGPLVYTLKTRRGAGRIAVHWHENPAEILREIQARTGLPIQP
jgi:hypothetical protein